MNVTYLPDGSCVMVQNKALHLELALAGDGVVEAHEAFVTWYKTTLGVEDESMGALDALFFMTEWFRGRGFYTRFAQIKEELAWWERPLHRLMFHTALLSFRWNHNYPLHPKPPRQGDWL